MSDLPRKAQDRVNTFGVVLIGMVAAVLLWVSVIALQAYYYSTAGKLEDERSAVGKKREVTDLKNAQRAELQEGKYVDPKKGLVTIPIDDATRLVLRDAKAGGPSLVPAIGAHDQPTVPAVSGRPPDNVQPPAGAAPPAGGTAPPAGGTAPPAGDTAPPAGGTAPPTTPAGSGTGEQPAPSASPATPTPPSPPPNP